MKALGLILIGRIIFYEIILIKKYVAHLMHAIY